MKFVASKDVILFWGYNFNSKVKIEKLAKLLPYLVKVVDTPKFEEFDARRDSVLKVTWAALWNAQFLGTVTRGSWGIGMPSAPKRCRSKIASAMSADRSSCGVGSSLASCPIVR